MYFCPYFNSCGGCQIQDKSYSEQIEYKKIIVSQYLREPDEIIASPRIWHYRNKVDFTVQNPFEVGFVNKKGKVININKCLIAFEEANRILRKFRSFIRDRNILGYSKEEEKGVKFLVLRKGIFTKEIMTSVVLHTEHYATSLESFFEEINVTSFYIGVNNKSDSRLSRVLTIKGRDHITERLLDNYYKIYPNTFFQTNSYTAEIMIEKVLELSELKGIEIVYDLYSGIGTFTIPLAKNSKEVIAVEISRDSINALKENMVLNKVNNINIVHSKVEDLDKIKADIIILDPPRGGIEKRFFKVLIKNPPKKVIYISCNPETQSRDLEYFYDLGYEVEYLVMVDQFPHTKHVETIVLLER